MKIHTLYFALLTIFLFRSSSVISQDWFDQFLLLNKNRTLYIENKVKKVIVTDSSENKVQIKYIKNGLVIETTNFDPKMQNITTTNKYFYIGSILKEHHLFSKSEERVIKYYYEKKMIEQYHFESKGDSTLVQRFYTNREFVPYKIEKYAGTNNLIAIYLKKQNNFIDILTVNNDSLTLSKVLLSFNSKEKSVTYSRSDSSHVETYQYDENNNLIYKYFKLGNYIETTFFRYNCNFLLEVEEKYINGISTTKYFYSYS